VHNVDDCKVKAHVEVKLERKRYMFVSLSRVCYWQEAYRLHADIIF